MSSIWLDQFHYYAFHLTQIILLHYFIILLIATISILVDTTYTYWLIPMLTSIMPPEPSREKKYEKLFNLFSIRIQVSTGIESNPIDTKEDIQIRMIIFEFVN
jgi:hypothetical protein